MRTVRFDSFRLKTISIKNRKSLVRRGNRVTIPPPDQKIITQIEELATEIVRARYQKAPIIIGMGAHLVKLGLGEYLIDLIANGIVHCVGMNGAAAFHDMELAVFGETSEDVEEALIAGTFGMAREPADLYNLSTILACNRGLGWGKALGDCIIEKGPEDASGILVACTKHNIPATIHATLGADVAHMHYSASGEAIGRASLRDFRTFVGMVEQLRNGVYVNIGSAVTMPEVFLKAVAIAFNQGADLSGLVTANIDMLDHYRPRMNVLNRIPSKSIDIRGRHEMVLPALHTAVFRRLDWIME